jgi:hypothetical protein
MIGTTSLSRVNPGNADRFGTLFGLPIEEFYDLSPIKDLDPNISQVRNAAVKAEYQNFQVGPLIWKHIFKDITSPENGSRYALILAASEVREAKQASLVYERCRNDYYDQQHEIALKTMDMLAGISQPSPDELSRTVMPRILRLYSKLGFKVIGKPVFYENYRMFDYPMLLDLGAVREPFKSFFAGD